MGYDLEERGVNPCRINAKEVQTNLREDGELLIKFQTVEKDCTVKWLKSWRMQPVK